MVVFSSLVVAAALLAHVAFWATVLLGVAAVAVFGLRSLLAVRAGRQARAEGHKPDAVQLQRRVRRPAIAVALSGVLCAVGMGLIYVSNPSSQRPPAWVMVGAPALLFVSAGYAWWVAGFLGRALHRSPSGHGPNESE